MDRAFLAGAAALLVAPLAGEAHEAGKVPRIGYLALNPAADPHLHEAERKHKAETLALLEAALNKLTEDPGWSDALS